MPHEYRVTEGAHIWEYGQSGLTDILSFFLNSSGSNYSQHYNSTLNHPLFINDKLKGI
jgi:hypothetical protein